MLPPDFQEHNGLHALTSLDDQGFDVGCSCGGWFHVYRNQPENRPRGQAWCKCDECGIDAWQPVQRSG